MPKCPFSWHPRHLYLLLTLTLVVSAFVLENHFNAIPCQMCWWQRYVHWAMLACAILMNIPRICTFCDWRFKTALYTSFVLPFVGLYLALWQILVEQGFLPLPESCQATVTPIAMGENLLTALTTAQPMPACDEPTFFLFGLTLAVWNVPAMLLGLYLSYKIYQKENI